MIIDIIKLLLSKGTREAFTDAILALKKSPEWKKDMINIEENFVGAEEKKARLLVKFFRKILGDKGWKEARSGVVEFAVQEIVDNAFIHGLRSSDSKGSVRIRALLTNHWADCQVSDTGPGFNLSQILEAQSIGESHGLSRVKEVASSLSQNEPNTIVVTIKSEEGRLRLTKIDDVYVLILEGEIEYSTELAYKDVESVPRQSKLIIDLTGVMYIASSGMGFLVSTYHDNRKKGTNTVFVVPNDSPIMELLELTGLTKIFSCATSRGEAIEVLNS